MKEIKEISIKYFTTISKVDSMLIRDHLEANERKMEHICKMKEIWKLWLENIGVPQQKELIGFMVA